MTEEKLLELFDFIIIKCVQIQDEGDYHSNSLATEILEKIEENLNQRELATNSILKKQLSDIKT